MIDDKTLFTKILSALKQNQDDISDLENKTAGIGTRVTGTISSTVNPTAGTATALTSISLTKGTWLINAQVSYTSGSTSNASGYRRCHIGTSSTGTQIAVGAVGGTRGGNTTVCAVASRTLTGNATIYLSCQTADAIPVSSSGTWIQAVKISA